MTSGGNICHVDQFKIFPVSYKCSEICNCQKWSILKLSMVSEKMTNSLPQGWGNKAKEQSPPRS